MTKFRDIDPDTLPSPLAEIVREIRAMQFDPSDAAYASPEARLIVAELRAGREQARLHHEENMRGAREDTLMRIEAARADLDGYMTKIDAVLTAHDTARANMQREIDALYVALSNIQGSAS